MEKRTNACFKKTSFFIMIMVSGKIILIRSLLFYAVKINPSHEKPWGSQSESLDLNYFVYEHFKEDILYIIKLLPSKTLGSRIFKNALKFLWRNF